MEARTDSAFQMIWQCLPETCIHPVGSLLGVGALRPMVVRPDCEIMRSRWLRASSETALSIISLEEEDAFAKLDVELIFTRWLDIAKHSTAQHAREIY